MKRIMVLGLVVLVIGLSLLTYQLIFILQSNYIQLTFGYPDSPLNRELDPFKQGNHEIKHLSEPVFDLNDNLIIAGSTKDDTAFVTKISVAGDTLWTVYFDGENEDRVSQIAINSLNQVVVAGETSSYDYNWDHSVENSGFNQYQFPVASQSIFLATINPSGDLLWTRIFGGSNPEKVDYLVLDNADSVIISGSTDSDDFPAPDVENQNFEDFGYHRILAKFSSIGNLLWSTFWGTNDDDHSLDNKVTNDIEIDKQNSIIVVGATISKYLANGTLQWTTSFGIDIFSSVMRIENLAIDSRDNILVSGEADEPSFPLTSGAFDTELGFRDNFLTKLNGDGEIVWSTFIGTNQQTHDIPSTALQVDGDDNVYVIGRAIEETFVTENRYENNINNNSNLFILKVGLDGLLLWKTLFGGNGDESYSFQYIEREVAFDINSENEIIITGFTKSDDLPVRRSIQGVYGGEGDAFIAKFNSAGNLIFSSFLGTKNREVVESINISDTGTIIITGWIQEVGSEEIEESEIFIIMISPQGYLKGGYNVPITVTPNYLPLILLGFALVLIGGGSFLVVKNRYNVFELSPDEVFYPRNE